MEPAIVYAIVFVYTLVLWILVLTIYHLTIESFAFGPLVSFVWKSLIMVGAVAAVITLVPGGFLASLLIWWLGLTLLFDRDFWESRMLIIVLWSVNFVAGLALRAVIS